MILVFSKIISKQKNYVNGSHSLSPHVFHGLFFKKEHLKIFTKNISTKRFTASVPESVPSLRKSIPNSRAGEWAVQTDPLHRAPKSVYNYVVVIE